MRTAVTVVRIIVGLLFIVSGLVKANDPLGLSYKMEEFFEIWNTGLTTSNFFLKSFFINLFNFLHGHTLALSVFMIALEVMAGVALLIGWERKLVLNLLLVLILFFTFLTGYAYFSGTFKNCGCFGDCLPITPLTSFLKDILLLALILFLLFGKKYIVPFFTTKLQALVLLAFLIFSTGFQWYVLNYKPVVDCLPFKKGNNIAEQMKIPANAVADSFAIRFIYEKDGKQFEFSPGNLPDDLDAYKFIDRKDKLVRKGNAEPAIKGFSLIGSSDFDSTGLILNHPGYSILYFIHYNNDKETNVDVKSLVETSGKKNIPVYAITMNATTLSEFFNRVQVKIPIMKIDLTAFRTAARTNPSIYLLNKGAVAEKWSGKEISKALKTINNIAVQKVPETEPVIDSTQ
ncbi:MAG: BT_3928 family protein [Chitinophagaceae bacterium]